MRWSENGHTYMRRGESRSIKPVESRLVCSCISFAVRCRFFLRITSTDRSRIQYSHIMYRAQSPRSSRAVSLQLLWFFHFSHELSSDDQHITRLGKIGEAVHSPGWSTKAILSLLLVIGLRWGVLLICLSFSVLLSYHSCDTKRRNPRMSCSVRSMVCRSTRSRYAPA